MGTGGGRLLTRQWPALRLEHTSATPAMPWLADAWEEGIACFGSLSLAGAAECPRLPWSHAPPPCQMLPRVPNAAAVFAELPDLVSRRTSMPNVERCAIPPAHSLQRSANKQLDLRRWRGARCDETHSWTARCTALGFVACGSGQQRSIRRAAARRHRPRGTRQTQPMHAARHRLKPAPAASKQQ